MLPRVEPGPARLSELSSPWREVVGDELEKLKKREDVVAVGLAGSLSYGNVWFGSDVDLELVLRGEHRFTVLNTERASLSVDFGIFGENNVLEIPYDTRPLYDPEGFLGKVLAGRDLTRILQVQIGQNLEYAASVLGRGNQALNEDPVSARAFAHLLSTPIGEAYSLLAGEHRTIKRHVSRLDRATAKLSEKGFFEEYSKLIGLPSITEEIDDLYKELELGYREIWPYFKGKDEGPRYMIQQPDSDAWFRNRILPLRKYDTRDAAWLVPQEFIFVMGFLFRNLTKHERLPPNFTHLAQGFTGAPGKWVARHLNVLGYLDTTHSKDLLRTGQDLLTRVRKMYAEEFPFTTAHP